MGIPWVGLCLLLGCAWPLGQAMSMAKLSHIEEGELSLEDAGDGDVPEWDSGEHAEISARMMQQSMRKAAAVEAMAVPGYFKDSAIDYYNQRHHGNFSVRLEDSDRKVKKAFGVMVYVTMVLAKTDCVKDEEREDSKEYISSRLEQMGCQLLPESEQEQQECTFDIFLDARSGKKAVVTHRCTMLQSSEEDHLSTLENC